MSDLLLLVKIFIYSFLVTFVISPFIISLIKRENVKQVILHYVDAHASKSGTPTMGGIIFVLSISLISLICLSENSSVSKMTILIFCAYGLVGFLDDFIKIKFKQNLGLRAYQKIIFQFSIAIFVGYFVYKSGITKSILIVPFSKQMIDVGFWIVPIVAFIYLATTNAVNLTDGLDGLASSTTFAYMFCLTILLCFFVSNNQFGEGEIFLEEMKNLTKISTITCGAMLSFLIFNCYPAKIFMGDTGSLALGSLVASLAIFSRLSLFIPFLAIMFVASAVSVIMQVSYYKLTRKRIFLMAPLHHHFEKKGVHEVRITFCYTIITFLAGILVIIFNIL